LRRINAKVQEQENHLLHKIEEAKEDLNTCGSRPCSRRFLGMAADIEELYHEVLKLRAYKKITKYQSDVLRMLHDVQASPNAKTKGEIYVPPVPNLCVCSRKLED